MSAPVTSADYLTAGDWESAALVGLAERVATATGWTYSDDTLGDVQVSIVGVPDTPDRLCVLDIFQVIDEPTNPMATLLVQARFRGRKDRPLDPKQLSTQLFRAIHNAVPSTIGGLPVSTIWRDSTSTMGRDTQRRWERSDNYTITVDLPSTDHRE